MPTESLFINETARDKIFYLNIRSLRNHHDQLVYELSELEYKPIAICLCETWLTDNDPLGLYQIEGYQPVEVKNRPNKRGGGLAVFVRNDMNYSMMNFSIDLEHMAMSLISKQGKRATLSVVYRQPSSSVDTFIENFDKLLFELKQLKHECFITGDFNIDMRKETNESKKLTSVCESYNLEITSYEATRVTATTSTCIDLFIANKDIYSSEVKKMYISDHYALIGEVNFESQNKQKERAKVKYRKLDKLKNPSILITFLFVLQHELQKLSIFSAAEQLQKFPFVLLRILDKYAPETIRKRKENKQLFISNITKRLMKQRDKAAKQSKAKNNAANREKFRVLRNKVVSSLRMDEKQFYEKSLKDQKDPKKFFKVFNQISKAKKSSCSISVNRFNNIFANVGSKSQVVQSS